MFGGRVGPSTSKLVRYNNFMSSTLLLLPFELLLPTVCLFEGRLHYLVLNTICSVPCSQEDPTVKYSPPFFPPSTDVLSVFPAQRTSCTSSEHGESCPLTQALTVKSLCLITFIHITKKRDCYWAFYMNYNVSLGNVSPPCSHPHNQLKKNIKFWCWKWS